MQWQLIFYKTVPGLFIIISGAVRAGPKEHSLSLCSYILYGHARLACVTLIEWGLLHLNNLSEQHFSVNLTNCISSLSLKRIQCLHNPACQSAAALKSIKPWSSCVIGDREYLRTSAPLLKTSNSDSSITRAFTVHDKQFQFIKVNVCCENLCNVR